MPVNTQCLPNPGKCRPLKSTSRGCEKEIILPRSLCVLLFSFQKESFSTEVYSHLRGDTHHWEEIWALGSTWKERATSQELGFWLWRDFGHSLLLIGAVKRICECERTCLCEFEPYLKCENTSRINVRLQYVWKELRGNLHPQVLLYTPHEGKKYWADSRRWLSVCAGVHFGVNFMTHPGEIRLEGFFTWSKTKEAAAI